MAVLPNEAFAHLHVHSEYSLLDGACKIKPLMKRIKALGQTSVALTDHGAMYGVIPFYQAAVAEGIHPVIGCEVYVARRTRHDREHNLDGKSNHLILLCENNTGYENLIKLVTKASLEGFYRKPRVDFSLLEEYHQGLICLSGCLAGRIPELILSGAYEEAKQEALRYQRVFGAENFFLEIQNHGISKELSLLPQLKRLSQETGIPLVATNDAHYLEKSDAKMQEVLLCIQTGKTLDDPGHLRFETEEFYVKSTEEMAALFSDVPEAVAKTSEIAKRCQVTFEAGKRYLPKFQKEGVTDCTAFFLALCQRGMVKRYGKTPSEEVRRRMKMETDVIIQMGYVDYFLIVWDYIRFARESSIPVGPGRGSGAGSLCAYCMGITQVDPIRYHLLFERFLNPERVSMPDFDVDFCVEGRPRVNEYVIEKYGADRVSEIITFDYLKAKGAVRDAGRAMGIPYGLCDKIAKLVDSGSTIQEAMTQSDGESLGQLYKTDQQAKKLLDMAMQIEGMPRHVSTNAAGVLISAVPIADYVPLQKNDETVVTQYPMQVLEPMGFLKFDFLGLRNLTIMRDCVRAIQREQPEFSLDQIPIDDQNVYQMLAQGETSGVFQFESVGMRNVLMKMQPRNLEDLTDALSLYRPGPRSSIEKYLENRRHPEKMTFVHPLLEPILRPTYGCMLYQEQVMEICRVLSGYSYGRADIVRRAMAKKKQDVMDAERQVFIYGTDGADGSSPCCGAVANGVPVEIANALFDEIAGFASYAFNKSHAVAYAYLAYQTAYLKRYYFAEDMAALLSSVVGETGKTMEYLSCCQSAGVKVLPPHINESFGVYVRSGENIRFGLLAVKGLGKGLIDRMISEREQNGAFSDFSDFCSRTVSMGLNKQALENLIFSGALDGLGANRRQMWMQMENVLSSCRIEQNRLVDGQMNLFGESSPESTISPDLPPCREFEPEEKLSCEYQSLGLYLSGHPLDRLRWVLELLHGQQIMTLEECAEGEKVCLLASLQHLKRHMTRKGEPMCFLSCEDTSGTADCVVFPSLYATVRSKLELDAILCIRGKLSKKEETISVLCESILTEKELLHTLQVGRLCVKISDGEMGKIEQVLGVAMQHPGKTPLVFYLTDRKKMISPKTISGVQLEEPLYRELCRQVSRGQIGFLLQ